MSTYTLTPEVTLVTHECGKCGVVFAMPDRFLQDRREDGQTFYCPNGHPRVFRESESDRLRRRLANAEARETHERDQRQAAERSNVALRGVVTRTKRRAAAGVCQVPSCSRTFQDVARHMASQHPDYVASS